MTPSAAPPATPPGLRRQGTIVTTLVVALAAVELWAVNLPVLSNQQLQFFGPRNARDTAVLLDLALMLPLGLTLTWLAWRRSLLPRSWLPLTGRVWRIARPLIWTAGIAVAFRLLNQYVSGGVLIVIVVAAEVALLAVLALRLVRAQGLVRTRLQAGHSLSFALQSAAASAFTGSLFGTALRVAISELALLCQAVAGWRVRPARSGAYFPNRHGEDDTVLIGLVIMIVVEAIPVHVLAHHYSPLAAWILTGLSAYSLLWLLGDMAARRSRPLVLLGGRLRLCHGLRAEAVVSLADISRATLASADGVPEPEVTIGSTTSVILELRSPVTVYGWFGNMRQASVIGLAVSEPERLLEHILWP